MILKLTQGCICDSLTIDGKEEIDLSPQEKAHVMNMLLAFLGKQELNSLLVNVLDIYGDMECSDTPCECCGDTVCTTTLEV